MPIVVVVLSAFLAVPLAFAHAKFVSSVPAPGAKLTAAPASVTITFDDDLDPNATKISVLGPNGQAITSGATVVSTSATKVASVKVTGAGSGTYTVNWHAVADDDKGVTEGNFSFSVGAAASSAPAVSAAPAPTVAKPASAPAAGGGGLARDAQQSQGMALLAAMLCGALLLSRLLPLAPRGR
jgi:methionine-rich copper-binding protein CopC